MSVSEFLSDSDARVCQRQPPSWGFRGRRFVRGGTSRARLSGFVSVVVGEVAGVGFIVFTLIVFEFTVQTTVGRQIEAVDR